MAYSRFTLPEDPSHLKGTEYIPVGEALPNTAAPIGEDSYDDADIEKHEDRFSITPLYTVYHNQAITEEYMIDRHLGFGAIKREDGTVVSGDQIGRFDMHLERLRDVLSYLMLPNLKVFSIVPEKNFEVMLYDGVELLDGPCMINPGHMSNKGVFSLDITILEPRPEGDEAAIARLASLDPETVIVYRTDGATEDKLIKGKASALKMTPVDFCTDKIELVSITFPEIEEDDPRELYVHSICIAC